MWHITWLKDNQTYANLYVQAPSPEAVVLYLEKVHKVKVPAGVQPYGTIYGISADENNEIVATRVAIIRLDDTGKSER